MGSDMGLKSAISIMSVLLAINLQLKLTTEDYYMHGSPGLHEEYVGTVY